MTFLYIFLNILFSVMIALLMIKFGKKVKPSERCSHKNPTPTAGGLIFVTLFFINAFYFYGIGCYSLNPLLIAAFFWIAIVGFIDDQIHLSYKIRFIVQFIVALLVIQSGLKVSLPLLEGHPLWGFDYFLTILLIIGLINACNFFDGLNGLLAGSVLLLLLFSYFFISTDQKTLIELLFIPLFIFYLFNYPNAKLFMGDTGSTFLGLFLSVLALKNQQDYTFQTQTALIHKGLIYTLTPMMFCWFDVASTLIRRLLENRNIFTSWKDYLFHHLFDIGYSHKKIAIIYYNSILLLCFLTYILIYHSIPFGLVLLSYFVLQFTFFIYVMKRRSQIKHIVFEGNYTKQE